MPPSETTHLMEQTTLGDYESVAGTTSADDAELLGK